MDYFSLTLIVTVLMTLVFPPLSLLLMNAITINLPLNISLLGGIVAVVFLCFVLMCGYGYKVIKSNKIEKPSSRLKFYIPLVLPFIWYLFFIAVWNMLDFAGEIASIGVALLGGHFFGFFPVTYAQHLNIQLLGLDEWHSVFVMNLLYDIVLILGFAAGERLAAKKTGTELKPFVFPKKIIVFLIAVVLIYAFSEFTIYKRNENLVETAHPSYNFRYAGGYSSIDLEPYSVENEENILAKLTEPSTFRISDIREMPVMDGAEAAYPVYSAFANACYDNIGEIQKEASEAKSDKVMPIQFSNTIYAYEKLISGDIDIFFGAKPSQSQYEMAENAGVELKLTPIGKEAFVFFVNETNPMDNLSSEQIRDIYSGKINNWRSVGGENVKIMAFQRPENSGSQTMMEYFMGDTRLRKPLEAEAESSMGDVVRKVAAYENSSGSLGYSFRYYTTIMMADSGEDVEGIKLLAVDGVFPDTETIKSDEYPYTTQLYAITVENRKDAKSTIEPFLEWITGPQGQQIVSDTGYVAID
ncbi:MAG: substrate-binding domain-containing protein [Clostridiales bacterium]|nr:substrate-binding domain-containing protein [Clostridiales bacterium]